MMLIELTNELAPIMVGLDVALLISGAAIVASIAANAWSASAWRAWRPRVALHRPVLAR